MIHFSDVGSGEPILLLHGFCENRHIWADLSAKLASKYRVISVDLPGFGQSSPLPEIDHSLDDVADVLVEELAQFQLEKITVVGHSLGGYVALALCELYPELIKSLVLVNSTTFSDSFEKKKVRTKVIKFITKQGVAPFINQFIEGIFYDREAFSEAFDTVRKMGLECEKETLIRYSAMMRDRPDRTFLLRKSEIPVMIIAGTKDGLVPVGQSKEMMAYLPKDRGVLLSSCGHMAMYEQPKVLHEHLSDFIT